MNQRLTKISTRTGDQGTTGLADGTRVSKDDLRIQALGDIDELNCALGVLRSQELPAILAPLMRASLNAIQNDLFDLGSELALPGRKALTDNHIVYLEQTLMNLNAELPPLGEFIIPGGHSAAAMCHLTRAICRRAERSVVALARNDAVHPVAIRYLNRLSDLLFVMARAINHRAGKTDILWQDVNHVAHPCEL